MTRPRGGEDRPSSTASVAAAVAAANDPTTPTSARMSGLDPMSMLFDDVFDELVPSKRTALILRVTTEVELEGPYVRSWSHAFENVDSQDKNTAPLGVWQFKTPPLGCSYKPLDLLENILRTTRNRNASPFAEHRTELSPIMQFSSKQIECDAVFGTMVKEGESALNSFKTGDAHILVGIDVTAPVLDVLNVVSLKKIDGISQQANPWSA